jgi:predicted transcriptional regulator
MKARMAATPRNIQLKLADDTASRLADLARSTGQSETFLAELAINQFGEVAQWQLDAIDEGIAAAAAEQTVEHADVKAWIDSLATDRPLPRPRSKQG